MSVIMARRTIKEETIIAKRKGSKETRDHLTRTEYGRYRQVRNWSKIEPIMSSELAKLSESSHFANLIAVQKDYVLILAFLQRISLPFEVSFPTKIISEKFPFSELPNFQYFDELYDRHYPLLYPMDAEKKIEKAKKKTPIFRTVASLWFSGYALKKGLGGNHVITSLALEKANSIAVYHKSSLTILRKMLAKETDSEIESKSLVTFDEAEKNLWVAAGIFPMQTQLDESLYNFAFSFLSSRVNGVITEDHFDDEGTLLFRYGKKTISQNSWKAIVKYIRYFAIRGRSEGITNLSESSISILYTAVLEQLKSKSDKSCFRVALRQWLNWLNRTMNAQFNIERIMPSSKRVLSKDHGRVFSMSKAYILIQTLLNDQSSLFNENNIMDFRNRRGCLLLLSTAARPQEIVNLMQRSLTKDKYGEYWIRFHKTKTIRNQPGRKSYEWVHQVLVKLDAVRWFNELMKFAPTEPLHFPTEWGGDDLTEMRLIATKHNDGPIRTKSLYRFLARIQEKLWPELKEPYFTPHNLRALHLTYRRLMGDDDILLERQAGHSHSSSKLPYTQTISAEEVAKFGDIFKKGVWTKTDYKDRSVGDSSNYTVEDINVDDITKISSAFMVTPRKLDEVFKLTQKVMEAKPLKFQGKVIENEEELSEVTVGGYTHNCNAHVLLNCGHTPGHCRACDYYSPDEGTEDAHKAEIFYEMILYYQCIEAEREFKSTGHRKMVFQKAEDIKERLDTTESKLWVEKFGMKDQDAKKLHAMLWKKSKTFFRQESNVKPKLSIEEILKYINSGS